ncbi:cyclase family protein [Pseudonocardia lacus]|uniref:cyclase family protein n=1 Tax=Pseudonocardia lacus TaxID=2835865 RepID=UPI001BDCA219|nr:cyclase family protein [Pseudonocardia lacus]
MADRGDGALPRYRDLPETDGGARSGWHLFGEDDSVGLLNLVTPEKAVQAAGLVRKGAVFPLDLPSDFLDPPLFGRGADRRTTLVTRPGLTLDDVHDNFYPQSGSQWDALAHVAFGPERFYNGRTQQDVAEGSNTIDHWGARGVVTRAVVLDVAGVVEERGGPGTAVALGVADLEAARRAAGVEITTGDALVLHTGFLGWYATLARPERVRAADRNTLAAVGIEHTPEMAEYLWDLHIAAAVTDAPALEVWPPDLRPEAWPWGFLHHVLIGQFGLAIGELWWLHDLVEDCRADGRWEVMLSSAPMRAKGGIGSPANALALK